MMKLNNVLIVGLILILTSCTKEIYQHGFNFEHSNFDIIEVNKTTAQDVLTALGTPTTTSSFGEKKFYYISCKVEKVAFFEPTIISQKVLAIGFNKSNIVKDINELTLDDSNKVLFSESKTEIKGNSLNAVQQILTNIGKFKAKKK